MKNKEENVLVKIQMTKEALEKIKTLKGKMNASSQSEVIRDAISLLTTVEEARNACGKTIISNKGNIYGYEMKIILPWE